MIGTNFEFFFFLDMLYMVVNRKDDKEIAGY